MNHINKILTYQCAPPRTLKAWPPLYTSWLKAVLHDWIMQACKSAKRNAIILFGTPPTLICVCCNLIHLLKRLESIRMLEPILNYQFSTKKTSITICLIEISLQMIFLWCNSNKQYNLSDMIIKWVSPRACVLLPMTGGACYQIHWILHRHALVFWRKKII